MELPRKMKEWSLLSVNSLNRGVCGTDSVKVPTLLAYEIHHDEYNVDFHSGCLEVNHSVIEKTFIKENAGLIHRL
jgi:hypothetical protein